MALINIVAEYFTNINLTTPMRDGEILLPLNKWKAKAQ